MTNMNNKFETFETNVDTFETSVDTFETNEDTIETDVDTFETIDGQKKDITMDIDLSCLDLDEKNLNGTPLQSESFVNMPDLETTFGVRRSKRRSTGSIDCENRRSTTKPKKLVGTSHKETVNYYLDKRVKKLSSALETIFEEPKSGMFMTNKRLKRSIKFPEGRFFKDKLKVKKRMMKAKKVHPMKKIRIRASMDLLMEKLMSIEQVD